MDKGFVVINEFGDDIGFAWLDYDRCCYVVGCVSLGREKYFLDYDEMIRYLWSLDLDVISTSDYLE